MNSIKGIFLLLSTVFLFSWGYSQEKYLAVTLQLTDLQSNSIKGAQVIVTTQEDISFEIKQKRKKLSFYLPPNERFIIEIKKESFQPKFIEIDLRDVPEVYHKDHQEKLELTVALTTQFDIPIPIDKYHFSERYRKVTRKS